MINKDDIVRAIAKKSGFTMKQTKIFLDTFQDVIVEFLLAGEKIKWIGMFIAEVKEYKGRIVRNPKSGEMVEIPTR